MEQQFCLRWNNHQNTLITVLDNLLTNERLVDVTLTAEGQMIGAHKVVLSACSTYFEQIFSRCGDKHPVIFLKDVRYDDLKSLLDYMYRGEVNVSQEQLPILIKTAESLKIKGLADNTNEKRKSAVGSDKSRHMGSILSDKGCETVDNLRDPLKHHENNASPVPKKARKERKKSGDSLIMEDSDSREANSFAPTSPQQQSSVLAVPQINNSNTSEMHSDSLCFESLLQTDHNFKEEPVDEEECKDLKCKCEPEVDEGDGEYSHFSEGEVMPFWSDTSNYPKDSNQIVKSEDTSQDTSLVSSHPHPGFLLTVHYCHRCWKVFQNEANLSYHKRYDCDVERRFSCIHCADGKKFKRKYHLNRHLKQIHGLTETVLPDA